MQMAEFGTGVIIALLLALVVVVGQYMVHRFYRYWIRRRIGSQVPFSSAQADGQKDVYSTLP